MILSSNPVYFFKTADLVFNAELFCNANGGTCFTEFLKADSNTTNNYLQRDHDIFGKYSENAINKHPNLEW